MQQAPWFRRCFILGSLCYKFVSGITNLWMQKFFSQQLYACHCSNFFSIIMLYTRDVVHKNSCTGVSGVPQPGLLPLTVQKSRDVLLMAGGNWTDQGKTTPPWCHCCYCCHCWPLRLPESWPSRSLRLPEPWSGPCSSSCRGFVQKGVWKMSGLISRLTFY